jgi:hypothetical protein
MGALERELDTEVVTVIFIYRLANAVLNTV